MVVILALYGLYKLISIFIFQPPMPEIPQYQYWGEGEQPISFDDSIKPFRIKFDEEAIVDLKARLHSSRYVEPYESVGFEYGFNTKLLTDFLQHWENRYDFAERENLLNRYPQFITNIQGIDVHFVHVKPSKTDKNVLPLLMLHGWPGSIVEFSKMIPMLSNPRDDFDFVFELIIPSLPGFGFSQAARRPGLGCIQMAVVMSNLMSRLGHERYYVHGGDWGSIIGSHMTKLYPQNVTGYHTSMAYVNTPLSNLKLAIGSLWPSMFVGDEFRHKLFPIVERLGELIATTGYLHIQATKPETIGVGLDDSPAGLAAWVLEKFINLNYEEVSSRDFKLKFTYDELIDNLMMYWISKSGTSAAKIYAESINSEQLGLALDRISTWVPTAIARLPGEILFYTRFQLKEIYRNIVQISDFPQGGHFAAMEEPVLLTNDIFAAISSIEKNIL